jgi:hypothetical protein
LNTSQYAILNTQYVNNDARFQVSLKAGPFNFPNKPDSVRAIPPFAVIPLDLSFHLGSNDLPEDREGNTPRPKRSYLLFDLSSSGVCRASILAEWSGGLLHRRFTLTHSTPLRAYALCFAQGGLFSVALSIIRHFHNRSPVITRHFVS